MQKKATNGGKKKAHLYGKGVSIYHREDPDRWMCSVTLEDGKRKYISGAVGAEFEECEEKFREGIEQIRKGTLVTASAQALGDYIMKWLEGKRITLKKGVYSRYKNYIKINILPYLGSYQLRKLNEDHVEKWIGDLVKKGLAASSIRIFYRVLSCALKRAVKKKLILFNPCEDVALPRIQEEEMQIFDVKQAKILLASLKGHQHEALVRLVLTTGIRKGELQALRWEDIDLEEGTLKIRRNVVFIPKQGYHENEPKSKAGRRTIPLVSETINALKTYYEQSEKEGLVFRGRGGSYFSPDGISKAWRQILEDAGLPHIRFHDLRHTAATLLLRAGASLKSVQKILGHANIQTTMRYIHLLPEMLVEDVKRLGTLLAA
jgi:integrase